MTGRQVTSFSKKQRYIEFKLGIDTSVSSLVGRRRLSREVFYHLYLAVDPVVVGWPFDRLMVLFNKLNEKGVDVVKIVIGGEGFGGRLYVKIRVPTVCVWKN